MPLKVFFRKLLRPFAPLPLPAGQAFSRLDVKAEALGTDLVERAFSETDALPAMARALAALLGDVDHAELALKKAVHGTFETRLRILALRNDPPLGPVPLPDDAHPLDSWLAGRLGVFAPVTRTADRLWHMVELASVAVGLLGRSLWIAVRFGRRRVKTRRCRLLVLNAWPEARWLTIADAFHEYTGFRRNDLLAEVNPTAPTGFDILPTVEPDTLPVALGPWLREAVLGSARLAFRALAVGVAGRRDPRVVEGAVQALRLANRTLDVRRLVGAVVFEVCVDNMEYDPRHILVGALARPFGGRMVRWPHSEMDSPGLMLSYLGYDLYLSGGPYQHTAFGHTWLQSAHAVAVGTWQNDARFRAAINARADVRDAIEPRLAKGQKMIVVFGPSDLPGLWPTFADMLVALLAVMDARDGWFVVVKPKLANALYERIANDGRLTGWTQRADVIPLRYGTPSVEICPAGYLIEHMACGLTLSSSTVIEALTQNRPHFVYYPVRQATPQKDALQACGLLHTGLASLKNGLARFMDDPNDLAIPYDWFRDSFDPFDDDRALARITGALFPKTATTANATQVTYEERTDRRRRRRPLRV